MPSTPSVLHGSRQLTLLGPLCLYAHVCEVLIQGVRSTERWLWHGKPEALQPVLLTPSSIEWVFAVSLLLAPVLLPCSKSPSNSCGCVVHLTWNTDSHGARVSSQAQHGTTPGQRRVSLTTVYGERPELQQTHLLGGALGNCWACCPDPLGLATWSTPLPPKLAREGFFHSALKNSDCTPRPIYTAVPSTCENQGADRPEAPASSSVNWGDLGPTAPGRCDSRGRCMSSPQHRVPYTEHTVPATIARGSVTF